MDRKTFINSSIRILILAIFAGFTALLVRKGKISGSDICNENRRCDQCNSFITCNRFPACQNEAAVRQTLNQRANEKR
jgi:hypothetical protein